MEKLITRKEAAKILGISLTTLDEARSTGLLSYVQYVPNGCVYFTSENLEDYIRKYTHQAKPAGKKTAIHTNPTVFLTTKGGGVPQSDRAALTDDQVKQLLDAVRGLPPYVFVMLGLYAGLRREEILGLQWDSVYLDVESPYLTVCRAWHTEHNRPVILTELKTAAAERNIPLPPCLIPEYGTVTRKGVQYYRTRIMDADGKQVSLYATTCEELYKKEQEARKQVAEILFRKENPTVADYCEKWLLMKSATVSASTLKGYASKINNYIVKPLGHMYMSDVTTDDLRLALVPVSKKSSGMYDAVNMLIKSIFQSAERNNLLDYNPSAGICAKGGKKSQKKPAL